MKKLFTILLSLLLITLCGCGKKSIGDVRIMTISDLHYMSPSLHDDGEVFNWLLYNSDGKTFDYSKEILDTLVETTIKENPDVLVISGDVSFNGAEVSMQDVASALKEIEDNGIDVLVMSGNHDILQVPLSYSGDTYERVMNVDAATFAQIFADYGYNENYISDENSNSFVYQVNESLWLICLDANYEYTCSVSQETIDWLQDVLKQAQKQNAYVISFTHQTLLSHNPNFTYGYVINHNDQIVELYKEYGVDVNFAGHIHIQDIKEEDGFYEVLTSCASIYENHYGIIEVNDNQVNYQTYNLDVQGYAKDHNLTDENLLNYNDYSRQLFLTVNSGKFTQNMPEDQKEEMGLLNLDYFIGKLDEINIDTSNVTDDSLFLETIISELGNNYNTLTINHN